MLGRQYELMDCSVLIIPLGALFCNKFLISFCSPDSAGRLTRLPSQPSVSSCTPSYSFFLTPSLPLTPGHSLSIRLPSLYLTPPHCSLLRSISSPPAGSCSRAIPLQLPLPAGRTSPAPAIPPLQSDNTRPGWHLHSWFRCSCTLVLPSWRGWWRLCQRSAVGG